MVRILFICHGNICRSTMAEYVMKHLASNAGREDTFEIDSAATSREEIGNDVHPGTRQVLQEHGIHCGHHASRQMEPCDYARFDHLIGMVAWTRRTLLVSAVCFWERRAWATRGGL